MFNLFNGLRFRRDGVVSSVTSRVFRVMFGMVFVYVGVNMAGDLVRTKSNINQPMKDAVQRYDAVSIVDSVVSDVGNAIADSFAKDGEPKTSADVNNRAKTVSASLEGKFREKMPMVNAAVEDIAHAVITPFQEAIRAGAHK